MRPTERYYVVVCILYPVHNYVQYIPAKYHAIPNQLQHYSLDEDMGGDLNNRGWWAFIVRVLRGSILDVVVVAAGNEKHASGCDDEASPMNFQADGTLNNIKHLVKER